MNLPESFIVADAKPDSDTEPTGDDLEGNEVGCGVTAGSGGGKDGGDAGEELSVEEKALR